MSETEKPAKRPDEKHQEEPGAVDLTVSGSRSFRKTLDKADLGEAARKVEEAAEASGSTVETRRRHRRRRWAPEQVRKVNWQIYISEDARERLYDLQDAMNAPMGDVIVALLDAFDKRQQ